MGQAKVIIHGGAGRAMRDPLRQDDVRTQLRAHVLEIWRAVDAGMVAMDAVRLGCQRLEDDPLFNAGTGSVIQSDGQIRMSASVMAGASESFSGVINVQQVQHPIDMAVALQSRRDRVVASEGAALLARELNLPIYNPLTSRRLKGWVAEYEQGFDADVDTVVAQAQPKGTGTIGVVVLDCQGQLAVGTSTGGRGFEYIGRVSDSATPAGNYANAHAAVSCTGIGEHILDASLASRIVVRATDGLSLQDAFTRSMNECHARDHNLAAIGISQCGDIVWGKTSEILLASYHDGSAVHDTVSTLPLGLHVDANLSAL